MNCLLNPTTDAILNKYDTDAQVFAGEDTYATTPMAALHSAEVVLSHELASRYGDSQQALTEGHEPITTALSLEEDIYNAFEQAISGRLQEVQQKLHNLSTSSSGMRKLSKSATPVRLSTLNWRYIWFFSTLALIFTLLGFDAMGLLVLFSR
jgi:hypothetical protein